MAEFRLFDTPGADVATIVTSGDVFKPFVNATAHVDDEARLQVTNDGLEVQLVDPSNVFMCDVSISAGGFDTYDVAQEVVVGVDFDELGTLIRRARKHSDDELTLSIQERELTATVKRGYNNHDVVSQGTMDLIDPDALRSPPEFTEIVDSDDNIHLDVDASAITDALSYGVSPTDYVEMAVKGVNQHTDALYIGAETATREERVAISNISTDVTGQSLYSSKYLSKILAGIKDVDPAEVSIEFNTEFPATFKMNRDDVPMRVRYTVAPRIVQNDD